MHKKVLQIQTNFLQEDEPHSPTVTTSKINYEEKLHAATMLQKILSIILAKNFIDCWSTLKQYDNIEQEIYKPMKINKIHNIDNIHNMHQTHTRETQHRVRYFQTNQENVQKPRSRTYGIRMHRLHTQQLTQQQKPAKRNKSARMINQQIQHSRASILQEIVDKLKNIRKVNEIQENNNQPNQEVLRKITHLERMIRSIKNQRKYQNKQTDYENSDIYQNQNRNKYVHNKHNIHIQHNNVENSEEDQQLIKTFLAQIQHIKKQIGQIKSNNQAILKSQLERSRASSISARHNHRHRDNNYFIPVHMMPPYMSFNPNYIPAPNMNIPHNMNPHQNSMNNTYSQQVNFKGEQKRTQSRTQQQRNSHTQTLSQAPTQSQFQNIKANTNSYANTEVKRTISEGVQTQSVQKNTIYTETEETKFKNSSSNKYNEQIDPVKTKKAFNSHYKQQGQQKYPYTSLYKQQIDNQKYRRPYTPQPKQQLDLKYRKPYEYSYKDPDYLKISKPYNSLYNEQTQYQTKVKFPYQGSNSKTTSNNYRQDQYDIYNYKLKQKLNPSSASNSNQNSALNYNIPVAEIAKLMKKIQNISEYVQNQNKIKRDDQFNNKPVSQTNNPIPSHNSHNSETKYEFKYNSGPAQPIQPIQVPKTIHNYPSNPPSIPQTQIFKVQQPIPQFQPNQSQAYVQPHLYPKPQTHSVSVTIPQQIQHRPITITRPQNDYTRGDQIKSTGTFYSKNNVYSDVDSSYSLGFPRQVNHVRNPSIQIYSQNTTRPNISFSNYCSICGRNCGCARSFTNIPRN